MAYVNTERCRERMLGDHYNYNGDVGGPRSGNLFDMEEYGKLISTPLFLCFSIPNTESEKIPGYRSFPLHSGVPILQLS